VRAVIQRVSSAEVCVAGDCVAAIGRGLLALVGVAREDSEGDADALAKKLVLLRVFPDAEGRMNRSLVDVGGELVVISQFTLLGDARRGRRPFFGDAADPALAEPLLDRVITAAQAYGIQVSSGRFRAEMQVKLVNDGPVTILLDTKKEF
jgi:D-tyrosyl-tRNA(Tyr) deacylase